MLPSKTRELAEELDSPESKDMMDSTQQQSSTTSPYTPFLPEHAETARLTEMALRSAIKGVVSCLLARIESSVEASVWRGVQSAIASAPASTCVSPRLPRSATPRPPAPTASPGVMVYKQDGKRRRRVGIVPYEDSPPPAKRARKQKKPNRQSPPKLVDKSQSGPDEMPPDGGLRGVSFEDNSQPILDESTMSVDLFDELASQL